MTRIGNEEDQMASTPALLSKISRCSSSLSLHHTYLNMSKRIFSTCDPNVADRIKDQIRTKGVNL